ncbi:MAG: YbhB/YbcL family Raf kinase inhibitor-like protein [Verrucomicrobiia bacterium]
MNARMDLWFASALFGCLLTASCADNKSGKEETMSIQITSTAFADGQPIPAKYTCDGNDISPPLQWTNTPANTKSFALIADDPDAPMGTWVHWVAYDLPANTTGLPEDVAKTQTLAGGAKQGLNDFRRIGYGGPCPPSGKPHRYFFKIYALDAVLNLKPGLTKRELLKVTNGHVLAEGQLMGTYQRR